jgi:tetratricopeptide (TPR) repeat protein
VAYRALTEGRLKLETLELSDVPGALADFERAIALDPQYALAHVGIAHAQFWRFQASRARPRPDRDALAAALAHARKAVEIDPELAEGHAALALFLAAADRTREAVLAGRVAVGLEPGNWGHQFRLGMAEWGGARLACLQAVVAQFPAFAYAHFGIGMVLVARGELGAAEAALAHGVKTQMSGAGAGRFPGRGLHWLLGLIRLAAGRSDEAVTLFEAELASPSRGMHAEEFVMDGYDGLGFARLAAGDAAGGAAMFEKALEHVAGHARSLIGLAECASRSGADARAAELLGQADATIEELSRSGRTTEAGMSRAYWLVASGRPPGDVVGQLDSLLQQAPPGPAGWTIPIEPWLAPLRQSAPFAPILARVAERAR